MRGRPHRKRLPLRPETEEALQEAAIHAFDDEAAWNASGHVFGAKVSPLLAAVLVEEASLRATWLQPRLTEEETREAVSYLKGILDRIEAALAKAAAVGDPNFEEGRRIIKAAILDPDTGAATMELWRETKAIETEARCRIAESGGEVGTPEKGRVRVGTAETADVRDSLGRRWKFFDRDAIRNHLKRLRLRPK